MKRCIVHGESALDMFEVDLVPSVEGSTPCGMLRLQAINAVFVLLRDFEQFTDETCPVRSAGSRIA
jgi:hypothetical protein